MYETLSLSNLHDPEVRADPYPFYTQLRSEDPVHWDESMGFWVLTRFADIASVYGDARFSRAQGLRRGFERLPEAEQRIAEPVYHSFSKSMFYSDPPYHTRLRGLVNNAFTPNAVEQMRPHVQRIVDSLLDASRRREKWMRSTIWPTPCPSWSSHKCLVSPQKNACASSNGQTISLQSWEVSPTRQS